ncbi:MAG: sulfotransferase [Pseudomonadales bacterium]|nr:sulfotransferase [Pseudomonadales bacterium]
MNKSKVLETGNNYGNPNRPLPVTLFNSVGRCAEKLGMSKALNVETMLVNAKKKSGLSDFGDEWFLEPLNILVNSINEEAKLTPLGKLIQKKRLEYALIVRLRVEEMYKKKPGISDVEFGKIIVIAGLQRTGTTMLHRLLASDSNMRALMSWEAFSPLPLPGEIKGQPDQRIKKALQAEKGLAYLAPEFFAIHPVEHDAPEEDVLLLDLSFMSQSPEATMYVPSYSAWLEKQDHSKAYQYLRKVMKILLWQQPAPHWVLKTPHHMEYLDILLDVFPEATIVQTHRDPQKTTGSFCSMVAHGRGVFSDAVDAKEVASHWVRKVKKLMRDSIDVRESRGEERFIDVSYYDLLSDPEKEVKRIYKFSGLEFDQSVMNSVTANKKINVQNRFGKHKYDIADFGLSKDSIENEYSFYRKRYAIPHE